MCNPKVLVMQRRLFLNLKAIPFEMLIRQKLLPTITPPPPPPVFIRMCEEHPDTVWLRSLDSMLEKLIEPHLTPKKQFDLKGLIRHVHRTDEEFYHIKAKFRTANTNALLEELGEIKEKEKKEGTEENEVLADPSRPELFDLHNNRMGVRGSADITLMLRMWIIFGYRVSLVVEVSSMQNLRF